MRAGRCSRFGRASLLDVTNAAVKDARTASVQRRLVLAGCNGTAAAVANSTCCSVIKTGTRGDAVGGVVFDCLPRSAEWLWQFGHFSPPLSGDVSEPVDPAVGWEKFTAGD